MNFLLRAVLSFCFLSTLFSAISIAETLKDSTTKTRQPQSIEGPGLLHLRYGYRAWNNDPLTIDSASLLMRDKASGRLVQIRLQETAPDSSIFSGTFSIQWDKETQVHSEFYIPPQELLSEQEGFRELQRLIQNGDLESKPFILRKSELGDTVIELFDTQEQAREASALFQEEMRLRELSAPLFRRGSEGLEDVSVDEDFLRSALTIEEQQALSKSRADVLREEQLERQARIERLTSFRMLPSAQRAERAARAKKVGAEGLKAYQAEKISEAALLFEQSRNLDPSLSDYDFQYGAALYKLDRHTTSLALLKMVDENQVPKRELWFYLGLNYYRLNDFLRSHEQFKKIVDVKDAQLGPSAAFYMGLIDLRLKKYESSRENFNIAFSTSSDETLIKRAESYLDHIQRLEAYERQKSKKWTFHGNLGGMYDSNVLLASDSVRDQGIAQDLEALRLLTQLQVGYRQHYSEKTEWATQFSFLNLYSTGSDFSTSDTIQRADPTILTLRAPYTIKGKWGERATKWEITPGYEQILMDLDGGGTSSILNSPLLNLSTSIVLKENWISSYHLNLRHDDSQIDTVNDEDNSDALKVELKYRNIYFTNRKEGRLLVPEVGYILNSAKGERQTYYRINLSLAYIFPWIWGANWNIQGAYYVSTYPDGLSSEGSPGANSTRSDQNSSLSLGFSRPLNDNWSWIVNTSYIKNSSSRDDFTYNKLNVLTSFGFSY